MTLTLKVIFIIGLVYAGNKWLLPKLLHLIALTKNQELFMMSIFLICFAIALLTSKLGMSLAFGAFLAGLMISESEYSYNAFGNFQPIKDVFASFFFVSIGMLLDISFVMENYILVIISVMLILVVKSNNCRRYRIYSGAYTAGNNTDRPCTEPGRRIFIYPG